MSYASLQGVSRRLLLGAAFFLSAIAVHGLPPGVEAFLSSVEERTARVHVIHRSVHFNPERSPEDRYSGSHWIFSKMDDMLYANRLGFTGLQREGLFDLNKGGGRTWVFDGDATYIQEVSSHAEFDDPPYSQDGLTQEDLIVSRWSDFPKLKKMGEGKPELQRGSNIYPGYPPDRLQEPFIQNNYGLLLGVAFGYVGYSTWRDALTLGSPPRINRDGSTGQWTVAGDFNGYAYELRIDPRKGFGLTSFRIHYPPELYDGRLYSELRDVEYRLIDDVYWYPTQGRFRIYAGGESYEEVDFEVLDLTLEAIDAIQYAPSDVFPDRAQGFDHRTHSRFFYFADTDAIDHGARTDMESEARAASIEMVRDTVKGLVETDRLIAQAREAYAGGEAETIGVPLLLERTGEGSAPTRLLFIAGGAIALAALGLALGLRRKHRPPPADRS